MGLKLEYSGIYKLNNKGNPIRFVIKGDDETQCWLDFGTKKHSGEHKYIKVEDIDLNYEYLGVECGEEGYHSCESHGCDEEGICRCYTIERAFVSRLDISDIRDRTLEHIEGIYDKSKIREDNINRVLGVLNLKKYFIDRLLSIYKLFDGDNWEVEYGGDYYGDSIHGVYPVKRSSFAADLGKINLPNKKLIEFLLEKEYGYLKEDLSNLDWKIEVVSKDKIIFPQKRHYNSVPNISDYSDNNYDLPRGILKEEQGFYRVIDGYHRLKNTNLDIVEVIVGYEYE